MSHSVKSTDNLPDELCEPPGFIGELVKHMRRTAEYDHPEFFLGAALSLLSVITGRKVQDYRGTRTNLFTVAVGPTGVGKEHARKIVRRLLRETTLEGPGKFTSGSAIMTALAEQPALLCQIDEIGLYLQVACSERAPSHLSQVVAALIECFTQSDSLWRPQGYADPKNSKSIDQPSLSVFGTTTPESFFKALSGGDVTSGFLGRILVFLSVSGGHVRRKPVEPGDIPERITKFIAAWLQKTHGTGDFCDLYPDPPQIRITPEAFERLDSHFTAIADNRIGEETTAAAIWSRTSEKTSKLAMLACLSRGSSEIDIDDANYAIAVANFLTRRMISLIRGNIASTRHEANVQRLLSIINQAGGVLSLRDLSRRCQWLSPKDRADIIAQLRETSDLLDCGKQTKTKAAQGLATSLKAINDNGWRFISQEELEELRREQLQAKRP